jgi:competence protein ComEC
MRSASGRRSCAWRPLLGLIGFVLGSGRAGRALGWFALAAALGCALIWARSSLVEQPRLSRPQVADVAGRVEYVE